MTGQQSSRVRNHPRISAAKLGEYLAAPANRRERILHDQKYQPAFLVSRYTDASNLIRAALLSEDDVPARLHDRVALLVGRPSSTKFRDDSNSCCIRAVRRFARRYPELGLQGLTPTMTWEQTFPLVIEDVTITVTPTVLLKKAKRDGSVECGALLLIYRKDTALDPHAGEAVAEMLRRALVTAGHENVSPKLCIVVDVFSDRVVHAPARNVRLTDEIRSACREIAVRWPSIAAA